MHPQDIAISAVTCIDSVFCLATLVEQPSEGHISNTINESSERYHSRSGVVDSDGQKLTKKLPTKSLTNFLVRLSQ